jgi:hypothetical protein
MMTVGTPVIRRFDLFENVMNPVGRRVEEKE